MRIGSKKQWPDAHQGTVLCDLAKKFVFVGLPFWAIHVRFSEIFNLLTGSNVHRFSFLFFGLCLLTSFTNTLFYLYWTYVHKSMMQILYMYMVQAKVTLSVLRPCYSWSSCLQGSGSLSGRCHSWLDSCCACGHHASHKLSGCLHRHSVCVSPALRL